MENCPNCKREIKQSVFSNISLLNKQKTDIINYYQEEKKDGYCNKCGDGLLFDESNTKLDVERTDLIKNIVTLSKNVPIVTIHNPKDWDYDVLGLVTGQSTTGTGVITEFTTVFTDFFGAQSNRTNKKIKKGETMSSLQMVASTLELGGNAVIGVDIDYAEVGGLKGMIMVCVSGTAIRLKNLDVLGKDKKIQIEKLTTLNDKLLSMPNVYDPIENI